MSHSAARPGPSPGFTTLELVISLVVAATLLALALPRLSTLRDRGAVRAGMLDLSAAFTEARRAALARRALVAVVLDTAHGVVEVRSAGVTLWRRSPGDADGIVLGASRDSAVYDPRGFGYGVSNLTVTVRRGRIVDTLTMSRLGRVRW